MVQKKLKLLAFLQELFCALVSYGITFFTFAFMLFEEVK